MRSFRQSLLLCSVLTGLALAALPLRADDVPARASAGEASAQFEMGVRYERGEGVAQSDAEAVRWFREAAEQGHGEAQYNLGWMHANGYGVPKDLVKAHFWFSAAAERKVSGAQEQLEALRRDMSAGDLSLARDNTAPAPAPAPSVEVESARPADRSDTVTVLPPSEGDLPVVKIHSAADLRRRYNAGDQKGTLPELSVLASAGDPLAQTLLGEHLLKVATQPAREEAFKWLFQAARSGQVAAQYSLALCFLNGWGVTEDPHKALRWLEMAKAGLGASEAKSYEEATRWFREAAEYTDPYRAAAQGYVSATRELAELIRYAREKAIARRRLLE